MSKPIDIDAEKLILAKKDEGLTNSEIKKLLELRGYDVPSICINDVLKEANAKNKCKELKQQTTKLKKDLNRPENQKEQAEIMLRLNQGLYETINELWADIQQKCNNKLNGLETHLPSDDIKVLKELIDLKGKIKCDVDSILCKRGIF